MRIVRKSSGIQSHNDAQGFRIGGEKPCVLPANSRIFHYGWVKSPQMMGQKTKLLSHWWHGNKRDHEFENFKYDKQYGLKNFTGTHPAVMKNLVKTQDWEFDPQRDLTDWELKDLNLWASDIFEKIFRFRIGEYKPYRMHKL